MRIRQAESENRNTDRCTADRIAVAYGNRGVNYAPVTASGKETADSPDGVCKRNCGNNNSRVFIEAGFFARRYIHPENTPTMSPP